MLSVVVFHAFPNVLRSGFVGVDVFFVISGFLITSILLEAVSEGRLSFADFYARRIRRIFPALIVVLIASLVAGAFLLLPDDFARLGKHTATGAGFIANLALWQEAGYFDVASDTKILLHLWSLGVEEQFYLIWPAFIWATWRFGLNRFTFLAAILCGSLILSIKLTASNPVAAFYSPASRFWELTLGALLAHVLFAKPRVVSWLEGTLAKGLGYVLLERARGEEYEDRLYRDCLSTLGLALILSSTFVIVRRHEFPGWWALMPTVGAYLTLAAGPRAWLNRLLLANPAMVWIGLISYPLYLWHWPLLAFARSYYGSAEPPATLRAGLMLIAVILAWLTYRYIERPIRFELRGRQVVLALATAVFALGVFGAVDRFAGGFPGRIDQDKAAYAAYFSGASPLIQAEAKDIAQNQCNFYAWDSAIPTLVPRKAIDPSCYQRHSDKTVLIIGDSNAADLYYGLNEVLPKDLSLLLIWSSGCQVSPIVEHIITTHHCNMANFFALSRIKADPPDVLLMSSNNSFDIDYIRRFSTMVKGYGVKHVIVLGQRPHWKPFLYKVVIDNYWNSTPRYIPGHQDEELMALTQKFQSQLQRDEPFDFVDELKSFCNQEGCLSFLGDDRRDGLITADTVHLRPFASVWHARKHLAPMILQKLGLQ